MDPATRSIPTVSSGMIGRAALPGCIIATTAISVTVTTGKEGGIDPEPWPTRRMAFPARQMIFDVIGDLLADRRQREQFGFN